MPLLLGNCLGWQRRLGSSPARAGIENARAAPNKVIAYKYRPDYEVAPEQSETIRADRAQMPCVP